MSNSKTQKKSSKSWEEHQKRENKLLNLRKDESELSDMIFGDAEGIVSQFQTENELAHKGQLTDSEDELQNEKEKKSKKKKSKQKKRKRRAWEDDGENEEMEERERKLRKQYMEQMLPVTSKGWSSLKRSKNTENHENYEQQNNMKQKNIKKDETDIFQTTKSVIDSKTRMPSDQLSLTVASRLKLDAHAKHFEFHPSGRMALAQQKNGVISLFKFDKGELSPLHEFPIDGIINSARFNGEGSQILVATKGLPVFVINLEDRSMQALRLISRTSIPLDLLETSPNNEYIVGTKFRNNKQVSLIAAKSKQFLKSLKHNNPVTCARFSRDSNSLYTGDKNGMVYIWDLRMQKCRNLHQDKGGLCVTAISGSPNDQYYAVGNKSGVVNIYDSDKIKPGNRFPKPEHEYFNLTHPISDIHWDPTFQLLGFHAMEQKRGVRMVHLPSFKVFPRFPSIPDRLSVVMSMAFSPDSRYVVFGSYKQLNVHRINDIS